MAVAPSYLTVVWSKREELLEWILAFTWFRNRYDYLCSLVALSIVDDHERRCVYSTLGNRTELVFFELSLLNATRLFGRITIKNAE